MNFLIVEDNVKTAETMKNFLQADGINIFTAEDSFTASRLLLNTHIDVILSDLNLPYRDGFSFARSVKSDAITKAIPVFIYSSKELNQDDLALAKRYGVDYCITEIEPSQIIRAAKKYLL